jgi:plastocyanin
MSRKYPLLFILLIAAISGCVLQFENPPVIQEQTAAPAPAFTVSEPSTVYVDIRGSEFSPSELKVVRGTTVKWRNFDSAQHAIRVDNVSSPPFDSRGSWAHTFNRTGSYIYNCSIYPWMKNGMIVVK